MARLQLDLSRTSDTLIKKLMRLCDLQTKKDVVENALMLLGWASTEARKGYSIAAVDFSQNPPVVKEISTPALVGAKGYDERMSADEKERELPVAANGRVASVN